MNESFIDDIRIIATEGGIDYWTLTYNHNTKEIIYEDPIEDKLSRATLTDELILKGLEDLLSDKVSVNKQIKGWIRDAVADQDAGQIDSVCADCIVQAGLFGDIIYG
jgi:hypothetical protein